MTHLFRTLRTAAAACLLVPGGAALANAPAPADDALAPLRAAYLRSVTPGEQADLYRDLFTSVLDRLQRSYATDVDVPAFVAAALKAIDPLPAGVGHPADVFGKAVNEALRMLDPYSRYLDPRSHTISRDDQGGSFGGLGLEVEPGGGAVRVVAPIPGSPAARAGLRSGDVIVRVDDQSLLGVPLADAIARMRGQPGTPVAITVRREGAEQEFTVSLTREMIRRQVLRWNMEGEVLVLRLGTFSGSVTAALQQAVAEATAAHSPRAVVLDMRGNGGGLLREAVMTADAFLSTGEIVSLRGRSPGNQRTWQADANELLAGVPMVVLIDRRSASATELVAAALQENGRAVVMGQRSFGKGTVQTVFPLGDQKGALKLTTAHYQGPSGRSVQRVGVAPDIELVAASASDDSRGEAEPPRAAKARVEQGRCASVFKAPDPGLSCALAYLQAGNVESFLATVGR